MSTFDRFAHIMRAEINSLLAEALVQSQAAQSQWQAASIDETIAQTKRELAAFIAEENRAKKALDEAKAEVKKYLDLATQAVKANNMGDARAFVAKKQEIEAQVDSLEETYVAVKANTDKMREMYNELLSRAEAIKVGKPAPAPAKKEDDIEELVAKYSGPAPDAIERELEAIKRSLKQG